MFSYVLNSLGFREIFEKIIVLEAQMELGDKFGYWMMYNFPADRLATLSERFRAIQHLYDRKIIEKSIFLQNWTSFENS